MARLTTTWLTLAAAGGASVAGVGAFDPARDGGLRAGSFAETTMGSPFDDPSVEGRFAVSAGYELVITCWGEGAPTIVLEPGHPDSGHDQFGGTPFLEELASLHRVCAPSPARARTPSRSNFRVGTMCFCRPQSRSSR